WLSVSVMFVGGILVGFGTRYASGCTSGHAITGLSTLQLQSLLAVVGIFAGGLTAAHLVTPYLFRLFW
ncbi:MAG: YeeE/YedE family protein, partial [Thiobacillus sp.]|nr:YeeE/YedE family protein [Thiobacillus sp.]